jgi:hypothetical protein
MPAVSVVSVVVLGAACAPTVMTTRATPSATPPALRLPNRAQPTRPRTKAITATTNANNPNIIAAPLKPELTALTSGVSRH